MNAEAPLGLELVTRAIPSGTELIIGAKNRTITGDATVVFPLPDQTALRLLDVAGGEAQVATTLTISLPDHRPAQTEFPKLWVRGALGEILAQVVDRPITFPGEIEDSTIDPKPDLGSPNALISQANGRTFEEVRPIVTRDSPTPALAFTHG